MFHRTFLAVDVPPPPELARVIDRLEALGKPVRTVPRDKLHLTLKFLGDTPEEKLQEIADLVAIAADVVEPSVMELCGLGAFPRVARPSVVWAGLEHAEWLVGLAGELDKALVRAGFAREKRPFQPHVTLARLRSKPPQALIDLIQEHETTLFGPVNVGSVNFVKSELTPEGSRYTVLAKAALG